MEDCGGETALFRASRLGHTDCVRFLLQSNADPFHCNQNLETALEIAGVWENKLVCGSTVTALPESWCNACRL